MYLEGQMRILVGVILLGFLGKSSAFKASVVEFEAAEVLWEDIRDEPFAYFEKNMKKLRDFVAKAKSQDSNIIVFPEYGLQSLMVSGISPELASKFSQILPETIPQENPLCTENVPPSQSLLRDLSCVARKYEIYLVANILTMLWNSELGKFTHFNTNVAFDRRGAIVARYRKFHAYHEPVITNNPSEPDISYFDTDFGARIGLMTCFDVLFDEPAKSLTRSKVDAIAFTAAWGDELPFLTAPAFHSGAARMLGTTILSSGHHYLKGGVTGSGIYSSERILKYSWNEGSKVLTASVIDDNQEFPHDEAYAGKLILGSEDLHGYSLSELKLGEGSLRIYANGTNCSLDYNLSVLDVTSSSSGYALLGKKGGRTFGGVYEMAIQVCGVVFCEDLSDTMSCGSPSSVNSLGKSTFDHISLSGVFEKGTIPAPVSMNKEFRPFLTEKLPFNCDEANGCTYESKEPIHNMYSFGLYGRLY